MNDYLSRQISRHRKHNGKLIVSDAVWVRIDEENDNTECKGCVHMKPILIGLSYTDYVPGMKLYLHQDYKELKQDDIVEIAMVNGFDPERKIVNFPYKSDPFFITTNGIKIIWNKVRVACLIERNETTSFIVSMSEHYKAQAERMLKDTANYEWTERNFEDYLEEKNETLFEMLLQYEKKRLNKEKIRSEFLKNQDHAFAVAVQLLQQAANLNSDEDIQVITEVAKEFGVESVNTTFDPEQE
jgi:hypothetical protein